tara:strand:- start:177 stop:599 length:423 start_codon:yes stop_codon:yes gene_type:complete
MFGLFSIYCVWIWIWSFLYINDYTEINPLISSLIAFIFTAITLSFVRNFTIMLICFLVLVEFFVFYFNYKKFIKKNKRFTIKKLYLIHNLIIFLIYNIYLYLNNKTFFDVYTTKTAKEKVTLQKWLKNRRNPDYLDNYIH